MWLSRINLLRGGQGWSCNHRGTQIANIGVHDNVYNYLRASTREYNNIYRIIHTFEQVRLLIRSCPIDDDCKKIMTGN